MVTIEIDKGALLVALSEHGGVYACAEKAGLSPSTIYHWLAGRRTPRLEEWAALMDAVGETLAYTVRHVEV